jgi:cell division transport system permease protein
MIGGLFFCMREVWLNLRRQGLMALACVTTSAVALTILAGFLLLAWQVHSIAEALPRQFEIHAFLQVNAPREDAERLATELGALPGIALVRLVPREQAWEAYQKHFPNPQDLADLGANPLPDKLEIVPLKPEDTDRIAAVVRERPEIEQVNDGREILGKLMTIARVIRGAGLFLALFLALGITAIISNAIRITIFARRRDIQIMQLVGATTGFIRFPFVLEGAIEGALGGAAAAAVTGVALRYLTERVLPAVPFVSEFRLDVNVTLFCAALFIGGMLMGTLGSLLSLRRFLRPV